jgi:hypothetical protein
MSLLSHTEPFTEGVDPTKANTEGKTEKVIILLTDGDNTENRWNTYSSSNDTKIDPRTKLACAEAKKVATVYTIRLGNEGNASMLRTCASDTGKYYDVEDVGTLTPVFQKIADEISKLRVSS